jgi:hypothetical protein
MHQEPRDKLSLARRRAVHVWLVEQGMTSDAADTWCDAWEAESTARGHHRESLDFWREAGPWIAERLVIRMRRPSSGNS